MRMNDGTLSCSKMRPTAVRMARPDRWRAFESRSHLDPATKEWVKRHVIPRLQPAGSSLKFRAIAEGEANAYRRLARNMEWDTAAGHAVLLATGGTVTDLKAPSLQRKAECRHGDFVAWQASPGFAK
jgi:3'(2'), 5'-bisphosphate nucleotidase